MEMEHVPHLSGIGTGVAFLFSIVGMFFPDIFPRNLNRIWSMDLYFEATTVILTLVLLGQLLSPCPEPNQRCNKETA